MWNIIKAQNYQIKRDNYIIIGLILLTVVIGIIIVSGTNQHSFSEMTGAMYLSTVGTSLQMLFSVILLWVTTRIAGWDFVDKTVNYELLTGHSRKEVFFGRLVTAFIWGISIVVIYSVIPAGFFTIVNGFGVTMNPGDMALRYLLMLFPVVRMICGLVCLAFVVKNGYLALIIGYLLTEGQFFIQTLLGEMTDVVITYQFATSNIGWLISDMNMKLGYVDGEDVMIVQTAVEPSMVIATVAVSIIVSTIYVIIGYLAYRKKDL